MYKELWFIVREYSGKYFSRQDGERLLNKIMNLKRETDKEIIKRVWFKFRDYVAVNAITPSHAFDIFPDWLDKEGDHD